MTARVGHWAGIGGYRDGSVYFVGTSANPLAVNQMFRGVVVRCNRAVRGVGSATDRAYFAGTENYFNTRGWVLLYRPEASNGSFYFAVGDSAGGFANPGVAVPAVPGALYVVAAAYNSPTGYIRVGLASASVAAGGGVDPAIRNLHVGVDPATQNDASEAFSIVSVLAANNVALDATSLKTAHDTIAANLRQGRDLDDGLAFALDRYWDASDWVPGTDWVDRIAAQALTPTGSPQRFGIPGRAA